MSNVLISIIILKLKKLEDINVKYMRHTLIFFPKKEKAKEVLNFQSCLGVKMYRKIERNGGWYMCHSMLYIWDMKVEIMRERWGQHGEKTIRILSFLWIFTDNMCIGVGLQRVGMLKQ